MKTPTYSLLRRLTLAQFAPSQDERYIAALRRLLVSDHETLNRVTYFPEQVERIVSEMPADGTPEATQSGYELAAYRMPNGSRFVTLSDASEATWQAYAAECLERSRKALEVAA